MNMDKLVKLLDSREFYEMMQEYRHADLVSQVEVVQKFEAVKRAVLEAAGKRSFVITGIEYSKERPLNYRVQLTHGPSGTDAWDGFSVPVENFGPKLLKPGTHLTVEIHNDK